VGIAGSRLAAGALAVALAWSPGEVLASPPADAAPAAACSGSDGVTVVVDFGDLPGGVQVRCVTEPVSTGFDALEKAGFSWTGTQRYPGLLCRIDGKPADAACVNAPPSDRYWAYWTADEPGGSWTYSDLGAGNRTPPPGSVEGWAFSDGCTRAPQGPACPRPTTTTRPAATPTTAGGSVGGSGGPTVGTDTSMPGALSARGGGSTTTTTSAAEATATSELPEGGAAPEPGAKGDDPDEREQASAATADDRGGGSAGGALVGVGIAAAIGALALAVARRRRAPDGEPA
jgi:hypothetical protein